jgi:tRNA A37 threonylcarbamoyladenosine dehydratase
MFDFDRTFSRTELLLGNEKLNSLKDKKVAIFGLGGVGSFVTEGISRCGIGNFILVDNDEISPSNINRQLYALQSTVGRKKTELAKERILDINPQANIETYNIFYLPETANQFDFTQYDYVVDAIDTVSGKLMLVEQAKEAGVPIISSMGAGNKLDPTAFKVADIYKTNVCPLAKVMRRELKKRGIDKLKVVYSEEMPLTPIEDEEDVSVVPEDSSHAKRRQTPGSTAFVPSVVGLIIAGEVIKDISGNLSL